MKDKIGNLNSLIADAWNQAALNKGGDVEQCIGEVLSIEEMMYYAHQAIEYFCELTGENPDNILVSAAGDTSLNFNLTVTLTEFPES